MPAATRSASATMVIVGLGTLVFGSSPERSVPMMCAVVGSPSAGVGATKRAPDAASRSSSFGS
jgi:hypothetical protein